MNDVKITKININHEKIMKLLDQKLNVINMDLNYRKYTIITFDYFKTSVPIDNNNGTFKIIDLMKDYQSHINGFCKDNGIFLYKTHSNYIFIRK